MRASTLAAALVLALASPLAVQAQEAAPAVDPAPAADPADVASPEAIIDAVYEVISGDWDRFRSLFHPTARLIPSGVRPDGTIVARSITPEEYITLSGPQLEGSGFHEREIAATTERYGSMVHVFSTYEARRASTDAEPFMRGINSFQLFFDGTRWWVLSIYWRAEDDSLPIPEKYLP